MAKESLSNKGKSFEMEDQHIFGVAAHLLLNHQAGKVQNRGAAPPVVSTTGSRFGLLLTSAITSKGHRMLIISEGGIESDVFIKFFKKLLVSAKRKNFL